MGSYAKRTNPTQIIHGEDNVVKYLLQIISNAKHKIDACVDYTRPYLAIEIKQLRNVLLDAKKRGIKIRYLTEITKDNLCYCKELLFIVNELRHLNGIKGNFYLSDYEYGAPSILHKERKSAEMMIYSGIKEIVEHQQYIFESIWNTSISAEKRIKEIETGGNLTSGATQVIDNPLMTQEMFLNLIKSAKYEILLILPTVNAFIREYNIGAIQLLKELSSINRARGNNASQKPSLSSKRSLQKEGTRESGVSIKIITPTNDTINKIIDDINFRTSPPQPSRQRGGEHTAVLSHSSYCGSLSASNNRTSLLQIRHLESLPKYNITTATILVVDRKVSLVFEKLDDSKQNFLEAVGLSTISTSKPTIMSYLSIFENFWSQVELYEKLKEHDKMQREFINIASHELRTPIQAILGYSTLVRRHPQMNDEMLEAIERNAIRLQSLTNNILDVSRIESGTLKLKKEKFNINEKIRSIINDIKSKEDYKIKIIFDQPKADPIFVHADKIRIYEVMSNLLTNAIKSTKKESVYSGSSSSNNRSNDSSGTSNNNHAGNEMDRDITISCAVKSNQSYNEDNTRNISTNILERVGKDEVIISIKDRGTGIDPDIKDKLFSKFVTRSDTGSGLGLYICKGIIESHGGRIWAMNNKDGKGATFSFSLPGS